MALKSFDHYNIQTARLDATVAFYRDVLGMTLGDRPALADNGAWMCVHGHAVVHINEVSHQRSHSLGAIDHVSFEADDFDGTAHGLDEVGVNYEEVDHRPARPLRQIYLHDPNQVRIELNFPNS